MSRVLNTAIALAWPAGTPKSKYAYKGGKATPAYKAEFKKRWKPTKSKQSNCDRSASLVARVAVGEPMPTGNKEQMSYKPKHMVRLAYKNRSPLSVSIPGDIIVYKKSNGHRHTCIRGDGCLYEAQHNKTYFHRNGSLKKLKAKRPKVVIFREK